MLSKNELKYIQSLGHKKQREETRSFVAEGPKMAEELLASNYEIKNLYATIDFLETHPGIDCPHTEVSEAELQKISNLTHANQVLIVAAHKQHAAPPTAAGHLTLMLDAIQDPGNFGTIIRTADWFGIKQVVCTIDCVDLYNPKVVQATMGSLCRVNVWYLNASQWLSECGIPVYGAMLSGVNIFTIPQPAEAVIVIGNEGKGISEELKSFITHPVTIPRTGNAESLNAAIATGIVLGCMRNNGAGAA